jgi:hypothetical protein
MAKKYRLNIERDVDIEGSPFSGMTDYILNLPHGYRFADDVVHVRGYDSLAELQKSANEDVIVCDCTNCLAGLGDGRS